MQYQKVKSVAKQVTVKGPALDALVLETMKLVTDVVGATLGPGGNAVLIERYEDNLGPLITKDGVTVFRSIGLQNSAQHCIMETARDASIRTASEAGDGTTTATILAEAIVRHIHMYCRKNPRISPQRVVRQLETAFRDHIEPTIRSLSRKAMLEENKEVLHAVALVSANGDVALADAVIQCFEITGDEGNVTISESSGASRYEVEKIDGYSIPIGYEDSCGKFYPEFINDPGNQRCYIEKPVFLLYHGNISEIQSVQLLLERVGTAWATNSAEAPHNVVLVATGFSETVLATLALNFKDSRTINVVPVTIPLTAQSNSQQQFLHDLSAVTGATILNPLSNPADQASLSDLGPGVEYFEMFRFKSSVVGYADESLLMMRIDELDQMLRNPESQQDEVLLRERKAKLSGGIAKLRVIGASNGELKEKRDRAEDAVCAVRGAIKHGTLPGGGWTLLKLCSTLPNNDVCDQILRPAFFAPVERLLQNSGVKDETEVQAILAPILEGIRTDEEIVYDFLEQTHVNAYAGGLLDSTPAVLEAVRNSISIAALLGTLGAIVVFARDGELERSEASATAGFLRDATNEADQRY